MKLNRFFKVDSVCSIWRIVGVIVILFVYNLTGCEVINPKNSKSVMFRNDEKHSGVYQSLSIPEKPSQKWKFKTGGVIYSSGTILKDKLYFGSGDSTLYCLDTGSGSVIWKHKTGGAIHSTPAVSDGNVYFCCYDGFFYALGAGNGKLKWKYKTDGEKRFSALGLHGAQPKGNIHEDLWDFFLSSPCISEGTVYFGTGSGTFYALDKQTGKEKWAFKTGGVIHSSPAIAYGNVYFGSWDTYLYALNAENGEEIWKFETGSDTVTYNQTGIQGSVIISDSMVFFGCRDAHIYALNAINGELSWKKFNNYSWVVSTPVIHRNSLIYGTSDSKKLISLNKFTGDSLYETRSKSLILSSPAIAGDQIFYGDFMGMLTVCDVNSGQTVWSYQLESLKDDVHQILKPDKTFNYKKLYKSYNINEWKRSISLQLSLGSILSSPVISNKTVYFGSADSCFYALQ